MTAGTVNIDEPGVLLSSKDGLNLVVNGNTMSSGETYAFRLDVKNTLSGYSGAPTFPTPYHLLCSGHVT